MPHKHKQKECTMCEASYVPISGNQKYCKECAPKKRKISDSRWHQANREKVRAKNKSRREAHPGYHSQWLEAHPGYHSQWLEAHPGCRRQWRQANKEKGTACVYSILNKITDQSYIGETFYYEERARVHKANLKGGRHPNSLIQKDYDKYGADAFEFSIIKEINKEDFQNEKELKDCLLEEEVLHSARAVNEGKVLYNEDPAIYALARVLIQERLDKE